MSTNTQIEWADKTWSPVVGCTQITPGCAHCYAKTAHDRRHKAYRAGKLQSMPQYAKPFGEVQLLDDRLLQPLSWSKPAKVFVNSQSDLFHDDIPDAFIARVWATMVLAPRHTFQILTKRPARMRELLSSGKRFYHMVLDAANVPRSRQSWLCEIPISSPTLSPASNIWLGVSVENQRWADERIPLLMSTPAAKRFLSCEPLLGPVDLCNGEHIGHLASIDWIIAGAESGHGARPMDHAWVRQLRDQCVAAGAAFMWKQDGTPNGRKISLPVLDGRQWAEMPELAHA